MTFLSELQRRNVFRVGLAYAVSSWLILQVGDLVLESFGTPAWVMQSLLFVLLIGAIPVLLFAWVYELTPDGLKREVEIVPGDSVVHQTRKKLDYVIVVLLLSTLAVQFWLSGPTQRDPDLPVDELSQNLRDEAQPESKSAITASLAPVAAAQKSIAVLPFVNLSSDPEQEYFSDGISEELLNVLAQIPDLRVAARTSSFIFKGDQVPIGEIAEMLNVNHVLEGSVRKSGTRLRITAQLIEADEGFHLWSETYDRELEDVFAIQDEIARAIATALKSELALHEQGRSGLVTTSNTPAYEAFLKGRSLINKRGRQAITEGVNELERSVRLDPAYAPSHALLAFGTTLLQKSPSTYGDLSPSEVFERATEHIEIAESLDPNIAELWAAKAFLSGMNYDEVNTLDYVERALEIRPNYVDPINLKINILNALGRFGEGKAAVEHLLSIDPLSVIGRMNAVSEIALRDPERAFKMATSLANQSEWASHSALAMIAFRTGEPEEELLHLLRAYSLDSEDLFVNAQLVSLLAHYGLSEEAVRIDRRLKGYALQVLHRYPEAEAEYRRQLNQEPANVDLQNSLATVFYEQGRYQEAVDIWNQWVSQTVHGPALAFAAFGSNAHYIDALQQVGQREQADQHATALRRYVAGFQAAYGDYFETEAALAYLSAIAKDDDGMAVHAQRMIDLGWDDVRIFEENPFQVIAKAGNQNETLSSLRSQTIEKYAARAKRVRQFICTQNPIPNDWRPLPSSCAEGL